MNNNVEKELVHDFWNAASCGEELYMVGEDTKIQFQNQMAERYRLEPYILDFADFDHAKGKKILEIGVGLGSDHQKFAENGADLYGCDLTERAVENTKKRLSIFGLSSKIQVDDAENLSYADNSFDEVYSWGVIHHSPKTTQCVNQIHRVLKSGGVAKVMIYYKYSMVGYMLWLRYAFLKFRPFTSLDEIYSKYLESPGTKAYSIEGAKALFKDFKDVKITTVLTHGDLLSSDAGQRHKGVLLNIARTLYPRAFVKALFPTNGLFMLIEAKK
jgi:ubiquinone/menaquinone biosynthesis C-methylase UbiE